MRRPVPAPPPRHPRFRVDPVGHITTEPHIFRGVCTCACPTCTDHPSKDVTRCICPDCDGTRCGARVGVVSRGQGIAPWAAPR